ASRKERWFCRRCDVMRAGPAATFIGTASCPLCHAPMMVKTNKHGWPAAYCDGCDTQFQPRAEKGSLLLIGRIHTWNDAGSAAQMLGPADAVGLRPTTTGVLPTLPPHLKAPNPSSPTLPKPKRTSWLDR